MTDLMQNEGLPYGTRTRTFNSRAAQELAAWSVTRTGGSEIHDALFRAYFVDGRNLSDRDVLLDVATSIGLSPTEAARALDSRVSRSTVDLDWSESRQIGISGVPTFVTGHRGVAGLQSYETLEQLVIQAGAIKTSDRKDQE
jgi:predicted DsbA family dithiol-disulfide isomerase